MEPVSSYNAGVTDLLERILQRGVMLRLDVIISVADIPLIGLSAQLAVASIETMNAYGMLGTWDADSRKEALRGGADARPGSGRIVFQPGEHVVLDEFASCRVELGWTRWRPGRLHVTNRRVVLTRVAPDEILFETDLADITGIGTATYSAGSVVADIVCLGLADGRSVVLRSSRSGLVEAGLRDVLRRSGRQVDELVVDDVFDDAGDR
ncbi:MAG: gas vesicle protein [Candidatus Nanopelagicales bacterium]|nr:gas vesicle protein [Candidatus Nanopelagicales bacterium]MDZ4249141.1 gas vesicle protein [Candidatus Nanopelagicales bacterium]MDZ7578947.1 gas vesicle protein [Candidatus Nanopelagicales bacterium]